MIYLDHAATTPVPREVAEEMYHVLTEEYGNPSSQYAYGQQARDLIALLLHGLRLILIDLAAQRINGDLHGFSLLFSIDFYIIIKLRI